MRILILLGLTLITNSLFSQQRGELVAVDALIGTYYKADSPGFSIGIVRNGELIYSKGVGLSDIEQQTQNSDSSIFSIASIGKQLTSACIWSLVREGRISLDDDIRTYIPEFPSYGRKRILIRHLLNHSSGIRNYHAIMELAGFDYNREYHDNNTVLNLACNQHKLNNEPGEKVIYGNTTYTLLAIIIERITGKNLDDYASEAVFEPLEMNDTYFRVDSSNYLRPNRVSNYVASSNNDFKSVRFNQTTYGAGSVGSTIVDLARWSNVLNGVNADYADLRDFLTTLEPLSSGELPKYARGVMIDDYKHLQTIHHSGYGLGGRSQILTVPELKLAVIVLTNTATIDPVDISYQVLDLFLPEDSKTSQMPSVLYHPKLKHLNKCVGQYKEQNSDMRMDFFIENDTLKAQGSRGITPIPLESIGKKKFVRMDNPSVLYDFNTAKKGDADLIVYFGGTPFYFSRATFIDPQDIDLNEYVGLYYSSELSVEYDIYSDGTHLLVNYPNHSEVKLFPGQRDEFGNGRRVLYHFERDKRDEVVNLYLSAEGTVKDIEFIKQ